MMWTKNSSGSRTWSASGCRSLGPCRWGNRSILFRDPDGNLVNLFTPVTQDAIKRFRESTAGTRPTAG